MVSGRKVFDLVVLCLRMFLFLYIVCSIYIFWTHVVFPCLFYVVSYILSSFFFQSGFPMFVSSFFV